MSRHIAIPQPLEAALARWRAVLDAPAARGAFLITLLTVLGLALRVLRLNFQPLWFDEGYSIYFAAKSIPQLIASTAVDIHPPLYYLLLKLWQGMWGLGSGQARWFSLLVGTATVPLVYAVGRQSGRPRAGLWAALFCAISPFHIYYSQEVRMYGLVTLLCLGSISLASRAFQAPKRLWLWFAAGVTLLAALYTQYYAAFVLAGLTVSAVAMPGPRRQRLIRWFITALGVCLAYLPWLWYTIPKLLVYVEHKLSKDADLPLSLVEFLRRVLAAYGAGHFEGWLEAWWPLGLLPPLILAGSLFALAWRDRRAPITSQRSASERSSPLFTWLPYFLTPLIGAYAVNLAAPFNPPRSERLLLLAWPSFCLLAGYAIDRLQACSQRSARRAAWLFPASFTAIAAVCLTAFYLVPRYPQNDYRPLAAEIGARSLSTDAVICVWPWQVGYFEAYLGTARPALIESPSQIYPEARQFWADDPVRMNQDLASLLSVHRRAWLPAYLVSGSLLEGQLANALDQAALHVMSSWYGTTHLSLYTTQPTWQAQEVVGDFSRRLRADAIALTPGPTESAYGVVGIRVRWEKQAADATGYRIGARLTDDQGRSWGQWDWQPLAGQRPFDTWSVGESHVETYGALVPAGTPPGQYQIKLSLRLPDDVPLDVYRPGSVEPSSELTLGVVHVVRPAQQPPLSALPIAKPVSASFDGRIRLVGHNVDNELMKPGEDLKATLFWQSVRVTPRDLVVFVQLLDDRGVLAVPAERPPTAGLFPTSSWQPGDLIRDPQNLRLPASLASGKYRLIVGLFDAQTGDRLPVTAGDRRGRDYVELTRITVEDRPHNYTPPASSHSLDARFGDLATLVGYDVETSPQFRLMLHWQAARETDRSFTVFVHAYDADGRRIGQHDSIPALGQSPTTSWLPGEFIGDPHSLSLSGQAKELWVGLYDAATGQRLLLPDGSDYLSLTLPH